jgi:MinD-like ATPase involved in chromosome partitioning or flagellar assembly
MNVSPDVFGPGKMTAAINPFFVVPTTRRSEDLLNAYTLIKQIARDVSCPDIGLVILGEDPLLPAEAIGQVIAEMAEKFLACNIHFMGAFPNGADGSEATLTQTPLLEASEDSPLSESIKRLADNLINRNTTHLKGAGNVENSQ